MCSSSDLLLGFVNTRPLGSKQPTELLSDSAALAAWMARVDLMEPSEAVTHADVVAAQELRDALVAVFRTHTGCIDGADLLPDAELYLERTADRYPLTLKITAEGCTLVPAHGGIRGAFAGLFAAAADLASRGAWLRMKTCKNCWEGFFDKTRNSGGLYCSTGCSSQASQRAYRNRLKSEYAYVSRD